MQWSPQQDSALKAVHEWLRQPREQCFYLAGYAGTGKTTLAQHFAQGVDGHVMFGAFTGKAAHVLQLKGCPGASTIHSMIYISHEKGRTRLLELETELVGLLADLARDEVTEPEEHPNVLMLRARIVEETKNLSQPFFMLNLDSLVQEAALVVIDECSMVDEKMGEDLLSFGTKVLVLGDPAQLPPVGGGGFFTAREPNFMLTEIHRQAQDNPIIRLATEVRNQRGLANGVYGDSRVIDVSMLKEGEPLEYDQLLVGKNATRRSSNRRIREMLNIAGDWHPVAGDKLVCLRNNHDLGLLNGSLWDCEEMITVDQDTVYMSVKSRDRDDYPLLLEAHAGPFRFEDMSDMAWWDRTTAEEFDFGYALTVHKSQGSQWDKVMLFDESHVFRKDKWKWLYTGITRAAEQLMVVKL